MSEEWRNNESNREDNFSILCEGLKSFGDIFFFCLSLALRYLFTLFFLAFVVAEPCALLSMLVHVCMLQ